MPFHPSTPHKVSSDQPNGYKKVEEIHDALEQELFDCWFRTTGPGTTTISEMFPLPDIHDAPTVIEDFINKNKNKNKNYDLEEGRWTCIPEPREEADLYAPYVKLIRDIVKIGIKKSKYQRKKKATARKIFDTHATNMPHLCKVGNVLNSKPDISPIGIGRSICKEKTILEPSYAQLLNPIEIKLDTGLRPAHDGLQLATYAREIFVQQHNRKFVFCVLLTETKVRVYRFDRTGSVHSPWFNIHTEPEIFVRIILGVTSLDEASLGYDTSISWDQRKVPSRWIEVCPSRIVKEREGERPVVENYEGAPLRFKIVDPKGEPTFYRDTIRGRGTTCWLVEHDQDGKQYLIKDCWRADGRKNESFFLEKAVGLERVGQIYAYQNSIYTTSCSASASSAPESGSPIPRELDRIVSQVYGDHLGTCESVDELVDAIRDIAIALLELLEKGIIHRDISVGNALRGATGSHIKGVLIDLDMAAEMQNLIDGVFTVGDFRTGTRAFQSIKVLRGNLRHHDHMDDLESVFYLLCWICYGMNTPGGKFFKPLPEVLSDWDIPDQPQQCAKHKGYFLKTRLEIPAPAFEPMLPLLEDMREFFEQRLSMTEDELFSRSWKSRSSRPAPKLKKIPTYTLDNARVDHKRFLDIIDTWKKTRIQLNSHTEPALPLHDVLSDGSEDSATNHIDGTKTDQTDSETLGPIFVTPTRESHRLSLRSINVWPHAISPPHTFVTPNNSAHSHSHRDSVHVSSHHSRSPKRKPSDYTSVFEDSPTRTKKSKTIGSSSLSRP